MASNFMWHDSYCLGSLVSHPHLCQECQATLDHIIGFDEIRNIAIEAHSETIIHTDCLGGSPSSYNPSQAWQFQETNSLPMQAFEASYGSHTELRGFQSMATALHSGYLPSSADLPDTDPTYQRDLSPSQADSPLHILAPSPHADQSTQFRCDLPSRQSPGTLCGQSFKQKRDLDRHIRTVHARGDDSVYRCSCQYKSARKDNFMRHLRRCTSEGSELLSCACICGFTSAQKTDHLTHLGRCGSHR